MASSSNHYYGHAHVLMRWVGLPGRPRPIAGILQHGWTPWYPWLNMVELALGLQPAFVPRLVWSQHDARVLREAGGRDIRSVGAPFLYLQEMSGDPAVPDANRLVALAFHTSEHRSYDPRWESYAEWLDGMRSQFDSIEVCLHPLDYGNPAARETFERAGFTTFSNGERTDPRFLIRMHERLQSAAAVTTPRLATGLIYAAALGRRVFVGGPIGVITSTEIGGAVADDMERAERFQREHYPQLFEGIEGEEARTWGREQLGAESLQAPAELGRTLGWLGSRRALSWALAAGATANRALSRVRSRSSSR